MSRIEAYNKYSDRLKSEIVSNCSVLEDIAHIIHEYAQPSKIEHFKRVVETGRVTGSWKQDRCEYFVTLKILGDEFIYFTGPHKFVYNVELVEELLLLDRFENAIYAPGRVEGMLIHSSIRYGCINHDRSNFTCNLKDDAHQAAAANEIHQNIMKSFTAAADTL